MNKYWLCVQLPLYIKSKENWHFIIKVFFPAVWAKLHWADRGGDQQSRRAQGRRRLENAEVTGAGDQGPGGGGRDALLRLPWSVHSVRHKPLLETPQWSCGGAEEVSAGIQSNKTKNFRLHLKNHIRIRITGNPLLMFKFNSLPELLWKNVDKQVSSNPILK